MSINFKERSEESEVMDDFTIGGEIIHQTLREIATVNRWLGGNRITLNAIKHFLKKKNEKPLTILDIGCGGGEMLQLIAKLARRWNREVKLIGIDANPHVIAYARENSIDFPEIQFTTMDVLSPSFKELECDILLATLFIHHFTTQQLILLFKSFVQQTHQSIIINDLHRHWFAYHSIDWITRILSRSDMVRNDARLSVLRAFSKKELEAICHDAGVADFSIRWKWAFRWELIVHK